jgi:uncharacterized protein (DUF58 family)
MTFLSPKFLQKLGRARLGVRHVTASTGIGERQSRSIGSGIEFTDHRAYQFGDDTRKVDPHLLARLGKHYVRQYTVSQALQVTILLDSSRSMRIGEPSKFDFGRSLAAALAYAGLTGGDQVLVGAFNRHHVDWHHRLQGSERTATLLAWLAGLTADGATEFHRAVRGAVHRIGKVPGLTIVISDWFFDGISDALATLGASGQEVLAVHLLSPEEMEPERLGTGNVRLVDAEVGHEVETTLTSELHRQYREKLESFAEDLKTQVRSKGGRYVRVRSDDDLERLFLRDWRREGLIA